MLSKYLALGCVRSGLDSTECFADVERQPDPITITTSRSRLVPITSRVILRADNQTSALLRTTIDRLQDIDQLLLVLQYPVQLIIITRAEITHHVLVSEEEHDGHWVIQLYLSISTGP